MANILKKITMGLGGIVLAALLLALIAPKTVHAVVSTLVTVANTSSNPVPTNSVKESAANYVTLFFAPSLGYSQLNPDGSSTQFSIPVGQQLVITDIDWTTSCFGGFGVAPCSKNTGDSVVFTLQTTSGLPTYVGIATYSSPGAGLYAGRLDTFKSGYVVSQLPEPQILFGGAAGEDIFTVTLHGYLVPAPASAE